MGATNINQTIIGKDLRTAYDNAVAEAKREYGDDCYNGTISTSFGAVEFFPKLGRVKMAKFIDVCWKLSWCEDKERQAIINKLPKRLHSIAAQIAYMLDESKFGAWVAIQMPYTAAAHIRKVNGLKGKQVDVWVACGWAAM